MDQQAFNLKAEIPGTAKLFRGCSATVFPVSRQSPEGPSNLAWPKVTRQTGAQDMGSPSDFFVEIQSLFAPKFPQ